MSASGEIQSVPSAAMSVHGQSTPAAAEKTNCKISAVNKLILVLAIIMGLSTVMAIIMELFGIEM